MAFNLESPTLNEFVEALGLRMAANEVGRRGVHTHNGSLHPRLFFFIATHPRLMDIASRANRRKTIIDLGAGEGNFLFVAASQSSQRRTILGIELVEERVELLDQRLGLLIESGIPVNLPEYVQGDFTSSGREDVNLEPYDHAITNGEIICWFNNAKEVMTRDESVQHGLERRLSYCRPGSTLVSLDRCFRRDPSWHEEGFVITVLRNDVSWHMTRNDDNSSTIQLKLYKYTKRSFDQEGVGISHTHHPECEELHFPLHN